jgi:hypothetical protein
MKILFVRERWADGDPNNGQSDGSYMIRTWQRINSADTWRTFYYDDNKSSQSALDEQLIFECMKFGPDIVMFSHLLSWGDRNIKKETWNTIRTQCGNVTPEYARNAKVVGIWHEGVAPDVVRVADEHADCVDLNLFIDTKDQFLKYTKRTEKCFGLYDPRDREEFKPAEEKTVGIVFNGTLVGRQWRCQGMFTLLANGIPVTKIGGRNELFLPQDQMIQMLAMSKICLNFSDAGQFKHYKGRVAEALLCGCMLLEWENDETSSILTPFRDYVPFSTPDDLLNKAKYYLAHDDEREKIARAGRESALEKLDGRLFWKSLFARLEIGRES